MLELHSTDPPSTIIQQVRSSGATTGRNSHKAAIPAIAWVSACIGATCASLAYCSARIRLHSARPRPRNPSTESAGKSDGFGLGKGRRNVITPRYTVAMISSP